MQNFIIVIISEKHSGSVFLLFHLPTENSTSNKALCIEYLCNPAVTGILSFAESGPFKKYLILKLYLPSKIP